MKIFLLVALCLFSADARQGYGPGEQEWDYATVRPGAHMFWWMYYAKGKIEDSTSYPLMIWLQGGPGASSTGFGNFEEVGPIDVDGRERNLTWVNNYNVLFIDNPVGTGYSYVDSTSLLTRDNQQIAKDLVELMKSFYSKMPSFKNVPLYVSAESYGGKMAADFALEMHKQAGQGLVPSTLKGVVMIDSWISPVESVMTWAPFLLQTGLIDDDGFKAVDSSARRCKQAFDNGQFQQATDLWSATEGVIMRWTYNVDFYNILKKISGWRHVPRDLKSLSRMSYERHVRLGRAQDLDSLMRGPVHRSLNIPSNVIWGSQSGYVFSYLNVDFMKPVTASVEKILDTTDIKVFIVSGQLDLIVDTPGTYNWAKVLQHSGAPQWHATTRQSLTVNGYIEGFYKTYRNFAFYWVERAGHMVPADNPVAMNEILKHL